jgi:hypothetical protein
MLSDARVRAAKPSGRPYKLYDDRGLFLFVTPTGGRLWRLKYRLNKREKLISLGAYPGCWPQTRREKRDEARKLLADGIDPSAERQERRAALVETFEGVAEGWLELQSKSLAPETISILGSRLNSALYPYLGSKPLAAITARSCSDPGSAHPGGLHALRGRAGQGDGHERDQQEPGLAVMQRDR